MNFVFVFISVRFSSTIEKTTWLKISDQMPNMNVLCKLGINLAGVMQAEYSISSVENPVRIQIEFLFSIKDNLKIKFCSSIDVFIFF